MVILYLFGFHAGLAHRDATLEAGVATTTVTGEHLDAVERRDDAALHAARVERLIALQRPVDLNQHPLQALQMKAGEAVAQHVVAEGALGADPLLEGRLGQLRFQLLKAGQAEGKAVKGGEEDGRRRDLRRDPGIGQGSCGGAEIKNLVQITGKGGEFVNWLVLPSHKCKIESAVRSFVPVPCIRYPFRGCLRGLARSRRSSSRLISEIFSR